MRTATTLDACAAGVLQGRNYDSSLADLSNTNVLFFGQPVGGTGTFTSDLDDISPNILLYGTGSSTTNFLEMGGRTNWPARYYRVRQGL